MGPAIDALVDGAGNVQRNPKLVGISFALFVLSLPLVLVGAVLGIVVSFVPVVGPLLLQVVGAAVLKPLFLGGVVGVAAAGLDGPVAVRDYTDTLGEHFLSLAGAYALYELLKFVVSVFVAILVVVLVAVVLGLEVAADAVAGDPVNTAALTEASLVVLVGVLLVAAGLFLAVAVVFQFVDVAVVVGDEDAFGALRESWALAREAPLDVLAYSVLRVVVGVAVLLPALVLAVIAAELAGPGTDVAGLLGLASFGLSVLLAPVAFAVVVSYHAAYYDRRRRPA